jgi:hypothetical protein
VNEYPVWTSDGQHIIFNSTLPSAPGIYCIRSDGGGEAQRLSDGKLKEHPYSLSPDGKHLALTVRGVEGTLDIAIAAIEGDAAHPKLGKPEVFLATPYTEGFPAFSPDGRWLAYVSNESGRNEVYVRPFPGPGGKWQISSSGGISPTWSRAASELLFRPPDGRLMTVSYTAKGDSFRAAKPQVWAEARVWSFLTVYAWDLAPDGKRVYVTSEDEGAVFVAAQAPTPCPQPDRPAPILDDRADRRASRARRDSKTTSHRGLQSGKAWARRSNTIGAARCIKRCLHTGTAKAVNGSARNFLRQPGEKDSHAGDVAIVLSGLIGSAPVAIVN